MTSCKIQQYRIQQLFRCKGPIKRNCIRCECCSTSEYVKFPLAMRCAQDIYILETNTAQGSKFHRACCMKIHVRLCNRTLFVPPCAKRTNQNAWPFNKSLPFSLGKSRIIQEIDVFVIKKKFGIRCYIRNFLLAYPSIVSYVGPAHHGKSFVYVGITTSAYVCINAVTWDRKRD